MTAAELASLPTTADVSKWTDDEKAMLEAAGLVIRKGNNPPEPAPRPTVVAFLQHCHRTGLDPIAKQIYAIKRGANWGIQISIDGARLVAQRSGQYAGQTPTQWTADGVTWVDAWLAEDFPKAARVGVRRRGFDEPLFAVARWDSYVVMDDEYEGTYPNRRKTGKQTVSAMWKRMPDVMLAKVAEMLALRKAFPMELSGLYSAEEMEQADNAEPMTDASAPRRSSSPTLQPGTRSAQRDPLPEPQEEGESAADEPVASEVTLYDCVQCGQPGATDPDGGICPSCEEQIEMEAGR